jgi:cation transport ATPase
VIDSTGNAPNANSSKLDSLLDRPRSERVREYRYRFGQALVFGLPVIGLQYFGPRLGGSPTENARWVGLLQALLAGWVMYVGAAGMLVEGILRLKLRRRASGDLIASTIAIAMYLAGAISQLAIMLRGRAVIPPAFHVAVAIIALWTAIQWWRLREV